jgi:hypothetical protein
MMKNRFLLVLVIITSIPALADWNYIGENMIEKRYVNPQSIHKKGDIVEMNTMYDHSTVQTWTNGQRYSSTIVLSQYDCKNNKNKVRSFRFYSGNMGMGRLVHTENYKENSWVDNIPDSLGQRELDYACDQH